MIDFSRSSSFIDIQDYILHLNMFCKLCNEYKTDLLSFNVVSVLTLQFFIQKANHIGVFLTEVPDNPTSFQLIEFIDTTTMEIRKYLQL